MEFLTGICNFYLLLHILVREVYSQSFTSKPNSPEYQLKGQSAFLTWNFNSNGKTVSQILWFHNDTWVATKPSIGPATVLNSQYQVLGDATLRISNVQAKDNGDFDCQVFFTNSLPPVIKDTATLVVVVSPIITLKTTTALTLDEGATRTLLCVASGNPEPTYMWYKDNIKIQEDRNNSHYTITSASRNDAGTYRCEAVVNVPTLGQYSDSYTVQVTVRFRPVHEKNSLCSNQTVLEGHTATFYCLTEAFPTATTNKWFKDGNEISNSQDFETLKISNTESRLTIKNATKGSAGQYSCDGTNAVGTGDRKSAFLLVNLPSSITQITQDQNVTEGDNLTLTCNASGMPQPNVSWIKPGGQRHNGHMLEFTNINRSQAGEYKCEASNECGNGTETATIHVLYTPRITNISDEQIVNNGDVVSFFCITEGNPAPKITWTKVADNSQVNFPLTIRDSQDEGMYRCTAENGVGSPVTKFVNMTVHFPAAIVAMGNHTVVKNGTIELYCYVSGTPPATVLWTHVKSGKTWNQKKWTVSDIQVEELGEYRCNASNKYGGDIKSTFILYEGGFCEKRCTDGKSCLKFGATYVCICPKGETGEKCEKTDTPKKDFVVGLKLKGEFKQAYEDLENPETKTLVKKIEKNMMKEFNGTGLASVKVIKLRQGSIIADLELKFNNSVGESNVNALLTQAANKGKIGDMEVEEFSVGNNFPGPTTTSQPPEDCGTFFEGEDCKKAKPGLIVLCVIGGVAVLAIIVAIIAYGLHKKKSNVASFSNGNYTARADPDGTAGSAERTLQGNNYGNVNSGYEYDKTNGQDHSTEMVTFKGTNPAQTPGIAINDSSMTKKAQPGEGMYADLGEFYQKAPAPPTTPVKMPPEYETTEYAEISQFLRGPVKTDEEKEDESNNDGNSSPDKDSSPDKGEDPSPDMGDAGDRNSSGPVEFLVDI